MVRGARIGFIKDNGLTLTVMGLFLFSWAGQLLTGWMTYNDELRDHGQTLLTLLQYVRSGHFLESTMENWESEFLQMMIFVVLSAYLYQRGSAESNPLPDEKQPKQKFRRRYFVHHPLLRKLYENSLSLALLVLFLVSFLGHWYGGWITENEERLMAPNRQPPVSGAEFLFSAKFWFQSFQNWQSEFLSIGVITFLSVYLRQKNSAQSKEVDSPHLRTEGA